MIPYVVGGPARFHIFHAGEDTSLYFERAKHKHAADQDQIFLFDSRAAPHLYDPNLANLAVLESAHGSVSPRFVNFKSQAA